MSATALVPAPTTPGSHFPATTILAAVHGITTAGTSLRGTTWWLFQLTATAPSHETVRRWLWRLGLALLQQPVERRTDWVLIVDHTLELGTAKVLLILGVTLQHYQQLERPLQQHDVTVLAVALVTQSTGVLVHQQLQQVVARVGVPAQIVSDHGSDLTKGIALLKADHPGLMDTYDIGHQLAGLLKAQLEPDARWQEFSRRCTQTRSALQQAKGGVPVPPALRAKARFLNVEPLVAWVADVAALEQPGLAERLAAARDVSVSEAAAWWEQTVGWWREFATELAVWRLLLVIVTVTQQWVQRQGLHAGLLAEWRQQLPAGPWPELVQRFVACVASFLEGQVAGVPAAQRYVGSSDVIESLFGSYKRYVERSAARWLGLNVLLLPLLVVQWTAERIAQALHSVSEKMLWSWWRQHGRPSRAQQRAALLPPKEATQNQQDSQPASTPGS